MKSKLRIALMLSLVLVMVMATVTSAQYAGLNLGTAYQLVNLSDTKQTMEVHYYDANGNEQVAAKRTFLDVEGNGSRLVIVPKDETSLTSGSYSAVVSSGGPVAGIVNEEFYPTGSISPQPPFASYAASDDTGATEVFLPAVMYNYFNYFTEIYIQNVGTVETTDVKIEYTPGSVNGVVVGAAHIDTPNSIKQYATLKKSQQSLTVLGAPDGSGVFTGRFFGSAKITSTQPIVVIVNEHNITQKKLMAYNGFNTGSTKLISPTGMRGFFSYYTALTITNMSATNKACVRLTYYPDLVQSSLLRRVDNSTTFSPVSKEFVVDAKNVLLRYEGGDSSTSQSDLMGVYTRFTGSVLIESFAGTVSGTTCTAEPLSAIVNVEATSGATSPNQAGSFNAIDVAGATNTVVAPVVLANYYGYYTTLVITNTTATAGSCVITYTSGTGTTNGAGLSKSYTRPLPANGTLMIYEGAADSRSDLNTDTAFWGSRFIGSAQVVCKDSGNAPIAIAAFVNEEKNQNGIDSMYTMNTIYK